MPKAPPSSAPVWVSADTVPARSGGAELMSVPVVSVAAAEPPNAQSAQPAPTITAASGPPTNASTPKPTPQMARMIRMKEPNETNTFKHVAAQRGTEHRIAEEVQVEQRIV